MFISVIVVLLASSLSS